MTFDPPATDATRDRILDVAERLFAEKGFEGTSVREITSAAGANVASVNYHFGGKDNLYREVCRRRLSRLREQRISNVSRALAAGGTSPSLEGVVEAFTTAFLEPLTDESQGRLLIELMAREMLNPHLPRAMFFEEMIDPVRETLAAALRSALPGLGREDANRCVHSIVGQLVHVIHHSRLRRGSATDPRAGLDLPAVARHIVRFSVGGIRAVAAGEGAR